MADATTRPATPSDADEIARIQRETWRTAYAELLPESVLHGLDENESAWAEALRDGSTNILLATEGRWTVGFCVAGKAPEGETAAADGTVPDDAASTGLIGTLLVEPRWGRRGHGGRLLVAAATQLKEQGATRGITWVPEADVASLAFFSRAGWEADGTVRTLDAIDRPLREVRLTGTLDLRLAAPSGIGVHR